VDGFWPTKSEGVGLIFHYLVSKISNLCDPDPRGTNVTDRRTDRRTDDMQSQCTSASRGKNRY